MGARTKADSAALRNVLYIFVAGSAFCFSAFTSIGPVTGQMGRAADFLTSPGTGRLNPADRRPFYLPYQYSSFADDTALYAGAYRSAERSLTIKGGGAGPEANRQDGGGGTIVAGTISHHLFIRNLIAEYFVELARHLHPKTIIIIGPNHHARGHSPIALSALRWRTPFGFVEPDSETIRAISVTGLASVEEEAFVNEHSIGAIVPFIRRTFPGARIVPIVFKKVADRADCVKLGRVIARLADSTLVLASLDFSHYKTSKEAEREDKASLAVLRSLSTERADNAFVDSKPALVTLLQFCNDLGATNVDVVVHTNSGILSHNPRVACTSYINTRITALSR